MPARTHDRPVPPRAPPQLEHVRMGPMRHVGPVLRELGHDPAPLLRASGLDATALDDPERCLAYRAVADLIRRGALQAGLEDFGLRVGERFAVDDLGLLGQLVWRARTVGQALHDLHRFFHLEDRGSITYVRPARLGVAALGYSILDPDTPGAALVYDMVMAMGMRLLRALAGSSFHAIEVWLPHAAPRQRAPWRRVFGAQARFDAPSAEILFADAWLHAPVAGADAVQHEWVQRAIRRAEAAESAGFAGRARAVVRALLMIGDVSSARVAAELGLHERTLRRRLAQEGEGLQGIVAQARHDVACQLLRETGLEMRDIAQALGFAEASVFVRAFRGWAGCSPGRWRAKCAR